MDLLPSPTPRLRRRLRLRLLVDLLATNTASGGAGLRHPLTNVQATPEGVIIVTRAGPDPCAQPRPHEGIPQFYGEPSHTGAVTLVSLAGDVVAYRTTGGMSGHFNFVLDNYLP